MLCGGVGGFADRERLYRARQGCHSPVRQMMLGRGPREVITGRSQTSGRRPNRFARQTPTAIDRVGADACLSLGRSRCLLEQTRNPIITDGRLAWKGSNTADITDENYRVVAMCLALSFGSPENHLL